MFHALNALYFNQVNCFRTLKQKVRIYQMELLAAIGKYSYERSL